MQKSGFSPAAALWDNREHLSKSLQELRNVRASLETATGGPRDFVRAQWLQVAASVYHFKPDLIIELGRGYGNSTCAMSIGAKMLRPATCRILSLCLATSFNEISRPHLDRTLPNHGLFDDLAALNADISAYDFRNLIDDAQRILVFWDAHGYELAIDLLTRLYPLLVNKTHLTLVHDMADLKYLGPDYRRYDNDALWIAKGSAPAKYILGDVGAQYEEAIALVDFLGRNEIPFRSAESSLFPELSDQQARELDQRFGEDFSRLGFWYHFSLNEGKLPVTFPPPKPPAQTQESLRPPSPTSAPSKTTFLDWILGTNR